MLKHVSEQDKGRNMSAASDQGGCRKKSRMRKPKATDSDGLSRAAQLPTEQTSTSRPPVARKVDDSFKVKSSSFFFICLFIFVVFFISSIL